MTPSIALAIKLLPEPDSPTRPRISPSDSFKLTRSIARNRPSGVINSIVKLRMSNSAMINALLADHITQN